MSDLNLSWVHMSEGTFSDVSAHYLSSGHTTLNDVVSTSMRRDHVASKLIRRHFDNVCLLGIQQARYINTTSSQRRCHVMTLNRS